MSLAISSPVVQECTGHRNDTAAGENNILQVNNDIQSQMYNVSVCRCVYLPSKQYM